MSSDSLRVGSVQSQDILASPLLDTPRAAEYLAISEVTLREYVQRGLIAVVRLPKLNKDRKRTDPDNAHRRKYQFRREDLDRFIASFVIEEKTATISATKSAVATPRKTIERNWWQRGKA